MYQEGPLELVMENRVRELAKGRDMMVSDRFISDLNIEVKRIIELAMDRAWCNHRKILAAHDV